MTKHPASPSPAALWPWFTTLRGTLVTLLSLCAFLTVLAPSQLHAKKGKWKLVKKLKDVQIYQMRVKGSPIIAMRGDAILNAPISKVVFMLEDIKHKTKWVSRLKRIRLIHRYSKYKRILYTHFTLPWPIAARDFVYLISMRIDHKNRRVVRVAKSVTHPKAPKTAGVRGKLIHSIYIFEPYDKGRKTKVRVELHGDPKGWLPAWMVNIVQRSWPLKTMNGIKKALKKPWIKEHKEVKAAFDKWMQADKAKAKAPTPKTKKDAT